MGEWQQLTNLMRAQKCPPRIDTHVTHICRREIEVVLAERTPGQKHRIFGLWVSETKLAPERLEVEINYRIPEPVVNRMGAGALSILNYNFLVALLSMQYVLSRNGRRADLR